MKISTNILTARLELDYAPGFLASLTQTLHEHGAEISHTSVVSRNGDRITRDLTLFFHDPEHKAAIVDLIGQQTGVRIVSVLDEVFRIHQGGKIEITNKLEISGFTELSLAYTPGVAEVCMFIHHHPEAKYDYTIKGNSVAIITDGTAVLGLGDIGPEAAMPVMEGKANLFKTFAGVNAYPIALRTKDVDEIVRTVKALEPAFGGINLEDISAPRCFEIERRLKAELEIPIFHDDQHGTAVVVLAGMINALKIVKKTFANLHVVVNGAGAAGIAVTKLLVRAGIPEENFILLDSKGILYEGRAEGMNPEKDDIAQRTNRANRKGSLAEACAGMDVFIGLSGPNVLTVPMLKTMNADPIVFAMSNPDPEIRPEEAAGHVRIMATGRSDYPNQVNNALCFPGLFRGALDARCRDITEEMKLAAARGIAGIIDDDELHEEHIIPSIFDKRVVPAVAGAVTDAARQSAKTNGKKTH